MTRLSPGERRALAPLGGWTDLERVRVHRGDGAMLANAARRLVLALSGGRACAVGNHVMLPDRIRDDLAVLAHEVAHCGQFQRWGAVRYFLRGAGEQLRYARWRRFREGRNPYAYAIDEGRPFAAYGMEEQGQLVEDAFRGDPAARRAAGLLL